jgi:protein-arginine kinase activator protein McsA
LQSQLKEAVDEEDYERAAVLRDRIRELGVEESPEEFELPEETEDAAE